MHSTTTPGKATPPFFLPAFTQTKRDTMPFFVWDGRSVINLGAWVFLLCVKTCWGEGRLGNSQKRSQSTRGAKLMKSLPLTSVAHWLLTQLLSFWWMIAKETVDSVFIFASPASWLADNYVTIHGDNWLIISVILQGKCFVVQTSVVLIMFIVCEVFGLLVGHRQKFCTIQTESAPRL